MYSSIQVMGGHHTRRDVVRGLAAIFAVGVTSPVLAQIPAVEELPKIPSVTGGSHGNFARIINAMVPQVDVLSIADWNHSDKSIREPLMDRSVMDAMKTKGIGILGLELPAECDGDVQKLWASQGTPQDLRAFTGRIIHALRRVTEQDATLAKLTNNQRFTAEKDFIDRMHNTAGVIMAASRSGLRVKAVDPQPLNEMLRLFVVESTARLFPSLAPLQILTDKLMRERLGKHDPEVARSIVDEMSKTGGKAAFFYGAFHILFGGKDSLAKYGAANIDDSLQENGLRVGTVWITNNADPHKAHAQIRDIAVAAPNSLYNLAGVQEPAFAYHPKTGRFYQYDVDGYPVISPKNAAKPVQPAAKSPFEPK